MFARNNFRGKLFFGTALVFCLSFFWGGRAQAALYTTYPDVSNTSTFGGMPTWEVYQIFKMPVRGRINSVQIKANGVDGGGTSMLRVGLCRATDNIVKAGCVGSYAWSNENPYIIRGLNWYTYTFTDNYFDKGAYVKLYFDKNGRALYWQEYAIKAPSSTYPDGITWVTGSSGLPELGFDLQVLLNITPCNDVFSGHVYNASSTAEALGGAKVWMILNSFEATEGSCADFLAAYGGRGDAFCTPGESAGLMTTASTSGAFSFNALDELGTNFTIQTVADNFATTTVPYSDFYAATSTCVNSITHDFYLSPVVKRTPVVIVPGILGSYLYTGIDEEVWPNILMMLLPGDDSYLDKLILESDGVAGASDVYHGDIMRESWGEDFFAGLISELTKGGFVEGKDLFVFPYDWRLDIAVNSNLLKNKIQDILAQTGKDKVNIIAHSMGGLVAKKYMTDSGQNAVDKFIDIATPHLGAPKAAKILMYGDNLGINVLGKFGPNELEIKKISQNMAAIYQLLPSALYLSSSENYLSDIYDADQNGISGNLDFAQSLEFLKNSGRNENLLSKNTELHSQIDNFDPIAYGVRAYNIIGCGRPTVGKIYILNKEQSGYEYGLKYTSGDGTVPLNSAQYLLNSTGQIYVTGAEHSKMPSFTGVKELVSAIALDRESDFGYSDYSNLYADSSICALNGYEISFHSPIELHVYDENNNHMGPDVNGDIEMGIVGASYDIIDGNKFAFLPKGHTYRIAGQATDNGTFNARIQNIENDETVKTQYFNSVPLLSASTSVQYALSDEVNDVVIQVDRDGDQTFENVVAPSAVLDQNSSADVTKPETNSVVDGIIGRNNWYTSNVQISLNATDEENGSGILKIEYSLDGGANWLEYLAPVVLNSDGRYNIQYRATDRAGNVENTKEILVNIDKTAPVIDIFAPLVGDEFDRSDVLSPAYDANDVLSGLATDTLDMLLDNAAVSSTSIVLFDYSLATHTIAIVAQDLAGNTATATVDIFTSTDIDGTIGDIGVLYSRGWLNDKANKQLVNELSLIKKQIQLFGQKKIKIDERFSREMNKCLAKKKGDWCGKKIKQRTDKIEYVMNKIYQRVITAQYRQILNEINHLQKKLWINDKAAVILKEDINYLINEIQ